ncbi:DNA primase family protein [Solidesulfovibrio carbinoliphilus]|nr:phage/plasmid primase, P4 family [Solidesulfovibrio carbinoliphilus]
MEFFMNGQAGPLNEAVYGYYSLQIGDHPPDGWFVLWTKAQGIFPFHATDITGMAYKIGELQQQTDVYVGMALQKTKPEPGKRGTGANTAAICGVWIEIDCQEGVHKEKTENLPTKEQALGILKGLPVIPTVIMDSGGGYHAHWWLDAPLVFTTDDERQHGQDLVRRFQQAVAHVFHQQGFKVDTTSDLARVLRPPHTFNHKSGQPVMVTVDHYDASLRYRVDYLDACCPPATPPIPTSVLPMPTTPSAGPSGGQELVQYPPVELQPIIDGCAWLRHCRDDAATLPEPEWFAALSIVVRCVNGEQQAHALSSSYPGYSAVETDGKIRHAQAGGPRTCANIQGSLNAAAYCATCPHLSNGSSPITLGFLKTSIAQGAGFNMTDAGNMDIFAKANAADTRYVWVWQLWFLFDDVRWQEDKVGSIYQKAIATLRDLADQAKQLLPPKTAGYIIEHTLSSESRASLGNMLALAKSHPALAAVPEMFDADPWLLNLPNGTMDLKQQTFRSHAREDMLTKVAGVAYDPTSTCPLWLAFLVTIMAGNQALIGFLQRFAGYTLVGEVSEQSLILLYGTGANGKSVFLEILRFVLGEYAMQADFTTFTATKGQNVRNDIARLVGARFVTAVESEYGTPLAEAVIKQVTGGEPIVARFLFKEFFQFYPQFTLWLASNHKPIIKGGDHGIWRRIKLVPFAVTIPPEQQDSDLPSKLKAEAPGILNWMLEGSREWQRQGLNPPAEVMAAVSEYRGEMDLLAEFLDEKCVLGLGEKVKAKDLYKAYREFCEAEGEFVLGKKRFADLLLQRGFRKAKIGDMIWSGLGLKQSTAPAEPPFGPAGGWGSFR